MYAFVSLRRVWCAGAWTVIATAVLLVGSLAFLWDPTANGEAGDRASSDDLTPLAAQEFSVEAECWWALRRAGHQLGVTAACTFVDGRGWVVEIW
ncbi:hypothetical protein [Nocardia sp. NPDC003183]